MASAKDWAKAKPGAGISVGERKKDAIRAGHAAMGKAEARAAKMGSSAPDRAKGHAEVAAMHHEAADHYERAGANSQAKAAREKAGKHEALSAKAHAQAGTVGKAALGGGSDERDRDDHGRFA